MHATANYPAAAVGKLAPVPGSHIDGEINRLHSAIDELDKLANILAARLEPVRDMRPPETTNRGGAVADEIARSPLGNSIRAASHKAEAMHVLLNGLLVELTV
jgi:hypothetical protein